MLVGESQQKNFRAPELGDEEGVPAAITDTGCERELNEDRYGVVDSPSGLAWLVCDGMGGVSGGELAAQLVLDTLRRDLENSPQRPPEVALRAAIQEANRLIVLRRQNPAFAQMGTTVVGALFSGAELVLGHVGDSRAYLLRGRAIQQLTIDHTFVQGLVEKGQIKPEEALTHPQAHILTRCIGSEPALEIDLLKFWIWESSQEQSKDVLLLCTDGLYSMISEQEICEIVSDNTPQSACVRMVELAKQRGGFDNITIAVIPLAGQLRLEPPPGYQPARTVRRAEPAVEHAPPSFLRTFALVSALSILAVLFTVMLVAMFVSE